MFDFQKTITCIEQSKEASQSSNQYDEIIPIAQILSCLNNLQSCAYINTTITNHPQISLLEQLFLRTNLKKEYPHIHIDYYTYSRNNTLTRGIVSQAEFQNLSSSKLLEYIKYYRYDYIIFDNVTMQSPFFNQIEKIIKDENITSQIIIIANSKAKEYFSPLLTTSFSYTKINELLLKPTQTTKSQDEINLFNINSPINISLWILIAYNFLLLKNKQPKRFFFMSTQMQSSREVAFISILKKNLKDMYEFGNWDFINLNVDRIHSLNIDASNEKKLYTILKQSFYIDGFTNIMGDVEEMKSSILDILLTLDRSQITSTIITNTLFNFDNSNISEIELIKLVNSKK